LSKNIAVIPARGGSKRLEKKNILPFNGKPMILYSVEAALDSGVFDQVVVSTEDAQIADCVKDAGCRIIQRSANLATDTARVVDVLKDVLDVCTEEAQYQYLCCLYATSPLRTASDIRSSFAMMKEQDADFCISVTDFDTSPFFAFDRTDRHWIRRRWPETALLPPWEKPDVVVDNGSIYWAKISRFLETGELEGEKTVGFHMSRERSVDIDTLTDFRLAEFYLQQELAKNKK
jgi:CMP-N-acetylneuraminic acid synthetase